MSESSSSTRVALDGLDPSGNEDLELLLDAPVAMPAAQSVVTSQIVGAIVGTVVGFADDGTTPLVVYPGQPTTAAQRVRATVDLHEAHIGKPVVLLFEQGDPYRPIAVGCCSDPSVGPPHTAADTVEIDADGQRMVVSAKQRLTLRCGKSSITLTREGKVIVEGEYVTARSAGVLRLKGGSVQIN